jgi:ATP-dependent RNA helicase DDX18/HAS1
VENFLNRAHGREDAVEVLPHHAAIGDSVRDANLKRFLATPSGAASSTRRGGDRGGSGGSAVGAGEERLVLVCTDRASRGMDSAFVEHVVLFDMPRDPSEYLRRVGRTTRGAGGTGVVSVLALGRQVKLAKEIIDRNQGGLALHRIPAALPVARVATASTSDDAQRLRSDMAAAAAATAAASEPSPAADAELEGDS